jgi:hypothetical protein
MKLALAALALALATAGAQAFATEPAAVTAVADEFRLIAAAHRDLRAYDLQIAVSVDSAGASIPLHAVVKCDGRKRCLRMFKSSTVLQTPEMSLMVDANERTITVTRHQLDAVQATPMDPTAALQAWVEAAGRVSGGELTPAGRHWIFESAKPSVRPGHMYVDTDSRLLRRFVYSTETPTGLLTTVDIHYTWGDPAQLNAADFETSRFVQEQQGGIVPSREYAQYEIIRADRK